MSMFLILVVCLNSHANPFPLTSSVEDDSPYPEVRSAVANTDDPRIPVSTFRAYVMGILWVIIIAALNQFFFFRYPSVTISGFVAQLLAYPLGRAWAKVGLHPDAFAFRSACLLLLLLVYAKVAYLRYSIESWSVLYQRTRTCYYHGFRRCWMYAFSGKVPL